MFEARAHIPTARLTGPRRMVAAAHVRRTIALVGALSVHLVQAAIVVLGFGAMVWFAAESSRSARARLELDRAQHLMQLDAKRLAPPRYDIHRIHFHELLEHVEDVARRTAR